MDGYYFIVLVIVFLIQGSFATDTRQGSIGSSIFNVLDYGAKGDGKQDDSKAFSDAWGALCSATVVGDIPTLIVPTGKTFLLAPISFIGPCKSTTVHVEIQGKLVAPDSRNAWRTCDYNCWLVFSKIDQLIVDGSGEIDGKGSIWWQNGLANNDYVGDSSCDRPDALRFWNCNGLQLKGLTHVDSPKIHISLVDCNNSTISNLHIVAPADSPNTDGIDIHSCTQVNILDSFIATGDDCIAIGSETSNINISGIICGPGHGISVGSLGKDGKYAKVERVFVRNCTFNRSTNGARIKTWQGGSGYARNITFEDIPLIEVENPIIIDQYYCDGSYNCTVQKSAVEVKGVTFKGFQGTSMKEAAINLNCSDTIACTNIYMDTINITSWNPKDKTYGVCQNANGKQDSVTPEVPCLS